MDISEQFFQMCEQAYKYLGVPKKFTSETVPSSQPNLWHMPNPGTDRWVGKHRILMGDIGEVPSIKGEGAFPIYRQDQLQDMLGSPDAISLLNEFRQYWISRNDELHDSIDKLWIEYVMWAKHSRRWSKGKWVEV